MTVSLKAFVPIVCRVTASGLIACHEEFVPECAFIGTVIKSSNGFSPKPVPSVAFPSVLPSVLSKRGLNFPFCRVVWSVECGVRIVLSQNQPMMVISLLTPHSTLLEIVWGLSPRFISALKAASREYYPAIVKIGRYHLYLFGRRHPRRFQLLYSQ